MTRSVGWVETVSGPVAAAEVGPTLVHEHLHMDASPSLAVHGYPVVDDRPLDAYMAAEARWNPGGFPDNYRLTDVALVASELEPARRDGIRTVVDATPINLGRDPLALQRIAELAGVHVVMGTGYYLESTLPPELAGRSADEVAEELIAEIRTGVEGTGIRPGIIGELGTGDPMSAGEAEFLRAAAWAQQETGLAVSVHLHPWGKEGERVVSVLRAEGVPPDRIALNHLSTAIDDLDYQRRLLDGGVYLAYDLFGFDHSLLGLGRYPPSDADTARTVARLVAEGYAERLLVSQDVGVKTRLRAYGGWGYAHLTGHVLPLLVAAGVEQEQLDVLLVANPARVLSRPDREPAVGGADVARGALRGRHR